MSSFPFRVILQNRRTAGVGSDGTGVWWGSSALGGGRGVLWSRFWPVFAPSVWEARELLMCITDSLITQNLPSMSPLCLPAWLLTTPFRAGWQQDRQRARCKLWEETGPAFPRNGLLLSSHLLSILFLLAQS